MVHVYPSAVQFLLLGKKIFCRNVNDRDGEEIIKTKDLQSFRSHFGISPRDCRNVWNLLGHFNLIPDGSNANHLLWTLLFAKLYSTEEVLAAMVGCRTVKTYMKWTWKILRRISALKGVVVSK